MTLTFTSVEVSAEIKKIVIEPGKEDVKVELTVFGSVDNVDRLTRIAESVTIHGIARPEQMNLTAEELVSHRADPKSPTVEAAVNQVEAAAKSNGKKRGGRKAKAEAAA